MEKIKKLLATLCLIHDQAPEKAKVYFEILKDENLKEVEESLRRLLKESKFFPKIPEILSFKKSFEEETELKWLEFKKNMNNNLRYESIPDWIYTIKNELGFNRCNNITNNELIWLKKDFFNVYELFSKGLLPPKRKIIFSKKNDNFVKVNNVFKNEEMTKLLKL